MLVHNKIKGFENKVNFVDKNNVCLGYDLWQGCCEHANWFFSDKIEVDFDDDNYLDKNNNWYFNQSENVDGYVFDTKFFQYVNTTNVYDGGLVAFKIIKEGAKPLYIHLFNCHNGYYSHGFNFVSDNKVIREDCI